MIWPQDTYLLQYTTISIKIKRENQTSILFLSTTDDYCQYWKNLRDMTLSSPNYPKQYIADGVGCGWQLSAAKGFIIALEFNHFHVSNVSGNFILF